MSTHKETQSKTPARLVRFEDVPFSPRFAFPEMADIGPVAGAADGAEMGVGFARMVKARIPWTIQYDEVLIVLSGVLEVHTKAGVLTAGPHDSIWLPAGTELTYVTEDCLMAYAVHPVNWRERQASAAPGGTSART